VTQLYISSSGTQSGLFLVIYSSQSSFCNMAT